MQSNLANQKRKDAAAEVEQQREKIRKDFYRSLARASGMDPDELEREFSQQASAQSKAAPPPSSTAAPSSGTPAK